MPVSRAAWTQTRSSDRPRGCPRDSVAEYRTQRTNYSHASARSAAQPAQQYTAGPACVSNTPHTGTPDHMCTAARMGGTCPRPGPGGSWCPRAGACWERKPRLQPRGGRSSCPTPMRSGETAAAAVSCVQATRAPPWVPAWVQLAAAGVCSRVPERSVFCTRRWVRTSCRRSRIRPWSTPSRRRWCRSTYRYLCAYTGRG